MIRVSIRVWFWSPPSLWDEWLTRYTREPPRWHLGTITRCVKGGFSPEKNGRLPGLSESGWCFHLNFYFQISIIVYIWYIFDIWYFIPPLLLCLNNMIPHDFLRGGGWTHKSLKKPDQDDEFGFNTFCTIIEEAEEWTMMIKIKH